MRIPSSRRASRGRAVVTTRWAGGLLLLLVTVMFGGVSLLRILEDGNILDDSPYDVNRAGFVIHGAIHQAKPEIKCVIHTHTWPGMAVSSLKVGQVLLVRTDGILELFDVLGAALPERRLGLAVPLLPLLRSRVDLPAASA